MKIFQSIRRRCRSIWRVITQVSLGFYKNDGLYRASALSFTTLLALVPLMSVTFTVLSAFPHFSQIHQPFQDFIFSSFVPETGKVIQQYLQGFAEQASQLSTVGLIFLVSSAVLLLLTIEQAMNQIWHVKKPRKGLRAIVLYCGMLIIAPIFVVLSVMASSYFMSIPIIAKSFIYKFLHQTWLLAWLPFSLALVMFTLLYVTIPNCKVRLYHGVFGALIAAAFFEIAKWGFTLYIQQFDTYELLYGAFSTIPLFFIWIYTVWVIVLLGAEVAHALSVRGAS